jgi:hypothetical protein
MDEMEYTTMPEVAEKLAGRWQPLSELPAAPEPVGAGQ